MNNLIEFLEREFEDRGKVAGDDYCDAARAALNEAHELQALLRKCARLLSDSLVRDEVLAKLGDDEYLRRGRGR